MFKGRTFVQKGGYKGWSIQFADQRKTPGVATTAYSYALSDDERHEMARRITAALNLLQGYTTDEIEAACLELNKPALAST